MPPSGGWRRIRRAARCIGYARSVERGGLFELTELFVHPEPPVGRRRRRSDRARLPERPRRGAGHHRHDRRARPGPLLRRRHGRPLPDRRPRGSPRSPIELDPDVEVIALRRPAGHRRARSRSRQRSSSSTAATSSPGCSTQREGYLYRRDGAPIGFAFVSKGGIGPIAALEPSDMVADPAPRRVAGSELGIERALARGADDQRGRDAPSA